MRMKKIVELWKYLKSGCSKMNKSYQRKKDKPHKVQIKGGGSERLTSGD